MYIQVITKCINNLKIFFIDLDMIFLIKTKDIFEYTGMNKVIHIITNKVVYYVTEHVEIYKTK